MTSSKSMRFIFSGICCTDAASEQSTADGVGSAYASDNDNVEAGLGIADERKELTDDVTFDFSVSL